MESTVQEIVAIEWELFGRVQNCGGRAACQDDGETFAIMRGSQLAAWSPALRESYRRDLLSARTEGRNPLCEKYAYMMERTDPAGYAAVRDALPLPSMEQRWLADYICGAHTAWQEALAERFPRLTGRGRPIRKEADGPGITSFETYLRGELLTYSVETLRLYADWIEQLQKGGRNLCEMVLENTVRQYGYSTLEEAEARQADRQT